MSINIEENIPLAAMTTMRVGGAARFFARVKTKEDLEEGVVFARERNLPLFILGGGSNTLVPDEGFPGLVLKVEIKGIAYEEKDGVTQLIAGAGERWDEVVKEAVAHGLWGIENLSLIPGTVGGAAVQNIGAYGVEACDTIAWVEAYDMKSMQIKKIMRDACVYGYRESIFKKDKELVVLRVAFDLVNNGMPRTEYEDIKKYFAEAHNDTPSLLDIRTAIIAIRSAKMPAPPLGTAGSFFKNPVISTEAFARLKQAFPEIKAYTQGDNTVKLSAAWLLDKLCGFRGYRRGDAGVHENQALIIVNHGNATYKDIFSLAEEMKTCVKEKTNIVIEEEVVVMRA